MELAVRSKCIVTSNGIIDGVVLIQNGKITGLFDASVDVKVDRTIDATDKVVLPGLIDTHVHIRYPGHSEREDFTTGTQAAAAGGITTIFEMPISTPAVSTADIVYGRMAAAKDTCVVDIGFYGGGGHGARNEFRAMADAGVIAYKTFLHRPQSGREHEFEGLYTIDDGALLSDLRELQKTNLVVCFHAESDPILEFERKRLESGSESGFLVHALSHPVIAEVEAVSRVILFAKETGARVSIVHVTSPDAAQLIREAKQMSVDIYAETCPQYLFFTEDDLQRVGPYAKINPPLRSMAKRDGLWSYVQDGTIDYIGTDHAPFTVEEKERGRENILNAPSGMPGLETELLLLFTAVHNGQLSLEQFASLTATNQAKIFGIDNRKGSIAIGKDADLVIVDPHAEWQLNSSEMLTKAKEIALIYDGITVHGKVETTILRGHVIYQNGVVTGVPGFGQIVTPAVKA